MITKLYFDFFKKNIKTYIFYLLALLHLPLSKLALPHIYGKLISKLESGNLDILLPFCMLIFVWILVQSMVSLSNYFRSDLLPKFMSYVRTNIINEIIDRYKNNYEDLEIGNTITKIIKSPWLLEDIFYISEDFIFRNVIIILTSFYYLFYYSKILGLIFLASISLILIVCTQFQKTCSEYSYLSDKIYDKTHEEIEDTLSNLISIYTSQKSGYEKKRIAELSKKVYKSDRSFQRCNNKFRIIFTFVFIVVFIVLNVYTFYIYKKKEIKLDILIAIIIINYTLLSSFMTLYYDTRGFVDIKGRIKLFMEYINSLPKVSKDNKLKINNLKKITIEFKDIHFYYTKDRNILKNFNLTIKSNDIIGLVGAIGSGKTTISKLLTRLNEYKSGQILLNNYEITRLNLNNLRSIINYIPQHPKLFNRTLFHNIVYGVERKLKEKDIYDILDKLNVPATTDYFKKNLHVKVGKNGSNLSGGQRQIVWLIRAILKNSKVIILDEPTASLDSKSKIQIIKFIKEYSKDRIIILITHDEELLKYVNRVVKIKDGKVISDLSQ